MAEKKRKVIRPIPSAGPGKPSKAELAERSHVQASMVASDEVPGGKMFAGRVYEVSESFAAHLVGRKGWKYADAHGRPTDEKPSDLPEPEPRPGQEGWYAEELDRRIEEVKREPEPQPDSEKKTPTPPAAPVK